MRRKIREINNKSLLSDTIVPLNGKYNKIIEGFQAKKKWLIIG